MTTTTRMTASQMEGMQYYFKAGWEVDETAKTKKYVVLRHPDQSDKYYLGKRGAVRKGRTVASSYPICTVGDLRKLIGMKGKENNNDS